MLYILSAFISAIHCLFDLFPSTTRQAAAAKEAAIDAPAATMDALRKSFEEADVDNSGDLTLEEVTAVMKSFCITHKAATLHTPQTHAVFFPSAFEEA